MNMVSYIVIIINREVVILSYTCFGRTYFNYKTRIYIINSHNNQLSRYFKLLTCTVNVVKQTTTYPVATSQTLMDLSREEDTTKSPLGTNVTLLTLWSCPCIVLIHWYVCWKSHNLMDRSALQDTVTHKQTLIN